MPPKEISSNTGIKLSIGQTIVIVLHLCTLIGGIVWGTLLAADFKSSNDNQHQQLLQMVENQNIILKRSWTVDDMVSLYANRVNWTNHHDASYLDRMELIRKIHNANQ